MTEYRDDPYKVLGVPKEATDAEVKKAYRKLALKHHPDRQTTDAARDKAQSQFAKISTAYEVLSDDENRREYDQNVTLNGSGNNAASSSSNWFKRDNGPAPTYPHFDFHDPYEVFKRDFRAQFGHEYPGAQYDFISQEDMEKGQLAIAADPSRQNKMLTDGTNDKPKRGFNPFRRNKSKNNDDKPEEAPKQKKKGKDKKGNKQQQQGNSDALVPYKQDSRAIVVSPGANNRPISMKSTTKQEGKVTTTETVIKRPDGSTETVRMVTGLPKKKNQLMLEGPKQNKMIEGKSQPKMITQGSKKQKKPLMLTNQSHAASSKTKTKKGSAKKQ